MHALPDVSRRPSPRGSARWRENFRSNGCAMQRGWFVRSLAFLRPLAGSPRWGDCFRDCPWHSMLPGKEHRHGEALLRSVFSGVCFFLCPALPESEGTLFFAASGAQDATLCDFSIFLLSAGSQDRHDIVLVVDDFAALLDVGQLQSLAVNTSHNPPCATLRFLHVALRFFEGRGQSLDQSVAALQEALQSASTSASVPTSQLCEQAGQCAALSTFDEKEHEFLGLLGLFGEQLQQHRVDASSLSRLIAAYAATKPSNAELQGNQIRHAAKMRENQDSTQAVLHQIQSHGRGRQRSDFGEDLQALETLWQSIEQELELECFLLRHEE
eukprot:m.76699 g.76699  ORF g.76699 m.76699 type:complete len:327 (+) comp17244_c0_seq2:1006-1986(+)